MRMPHWKFIRSNSPKDTSVHRQKKLVVLKKKKKKKYKNPILRMLKNKTKQYNKNYHSETGFLRMQRKTTLEVFIDAIKCYS